MVMFKRELASNDKIRVNNRGCSLYRVSPIELWPSFSVIIIFPILKSLPKFLPFLISYSEIHKKAAIQTVRNLVFHCQEVVGNAD